MESVSFVVPVRNGARWIRETLEAILSQADGREMEVIVVDDGSQDGSAEVLTHLAASWPLRIISGGGRGAAAAINAGVRAARFPLICQVDQDVVVQPGWMARLIEALDDPSVAAAQGYYLPDPSAGLCARTMNLDLQHRYASIQGGATDHVCTGNSVYRADALRRVGLFDEAFGYGYDNDMSYRLRDAGYRLAFCPSARSVHRWREGFSGYLAQQYGFGYGRLDIVAKHPRRCGGDTVSRGGMMAHPLIMGLAAGGLATAQTMAVTVGPWRAVAWTSAAILTGLLLERLAAGVVAARRFRDRTALLFPLLHVGRDLAWVAAIAVWTVRRLVGRPADPAHSMRPRSASVVPAARAPGRRVAAALSRRTRVLCLIPAHNEAGSLVTVIRNVKDAQPDMDVLVVDDGSTDGTAALLERLGVRWMRFPERMGVGSAVRAGLKYASRLGYETVVRVDGDGQHRAADIDRLLAAIRDGRADVVLGSRYAAPETRGTGITRILKTILAACLSALTRGRVTDATCGFCAIGPRALRVLAEHHPTGYPEPELRLFLSRNALSVVEVPVRAGHRLQGRTSLTTRRLVLAGARVALAMVIVPLRCRIGGGNP